MHHFNASNNPTLLRNADSMNGKLGEADANDLGTLNDISDDVTILKEMITEITAAKTSSFQTIYKKFEVQTAMMKAYDENVTNAKTQISALTGLVTAYLKVRTHQTLDQLYIIPILISFVSCQLSKLISFYKNVKPWPEAQDFLNFPFSA